MKEFYMYLHPTRFGFARPIKFDQPRGPKRQQVLADWGAEHGDLNPIATKVALLTQRKDGTYQLAQGVEHLLTGNHRKLNQRAHNEGARAAAQIEKLITDIAKYIKLSPKDAESIALIRKLHGAAGDYARMIGALGGFYVVSNPFESTIVEGLSEDSVVEAVQAIPFQQTDEPQAYVVTAPRNGVLGWLGAQAQYPLVGTHAALLSYVREEGQRAKENVFQLVLILTTAIMQTGDPQQNEAIIEQLKNTVQLYAQTIEELATQLLVRNPRENSVQQAHEPTGDDSVADDAPGKPASNGYVGANGNQPNDADLAERTDNKPLPAPVD